MSSQLAACSLCINIYLSFQFYGDVVIQAYINLRWHQRNDHSWLVGDIGGGRHLTWPIDSDTHYLTVSFQSLVSHLERQPGVVTQEEGFQTIRPKLLTSAIGRSGSRSPKNAPHGRIHIWESRVLVLTVVWLTEHAGMSTSLRAGVTFNTKNLVLCTSVGISTCVAD